MGASFFPFDDLQTVGRKLPESYFLMKELKPGEKLVGVYDWGLFKNAFGLSSDKEISVFKDEVGKENGIKEIIGYYAVPRELFYERSQFKDETTSGSFFAIGKGFSRGKVKADHIQAARDHGLQLHLKYEEKKLTESTFWFEFSGRAVDVEKFEDWRSDYNRAYFKWK